MKLLSGKDLAAYVKQRQMADVRSLRHSRGAAPKLAIIYCVEDPVITTYIRLKKRYGADLGVEVEAHNVQQSKVPALVKKLNADDSVNGIIIQLPLSDPAQTDQLVNLVAPAKDVDALGARAEFEPATPMAIMWLLAGYNVDLRGKHILLVGKGKLVGAPLEKMLRSANLDVAVAGRQTEALDQKVKTADVIITATGNPSIITAKMIKQGAVVVDAGVASESGKTVGDLAPDVYDRDDLSITPVKGGVGPLTVCALFENVIRAAQQATDA
jgi:methylenetetrahydrofolate dehydrogenase (NADP+)/methenyltetrahydrofolate cyclohydrolase